MSYNSKLLEELDALLGDYSQYKESINRQAESDDPFEQRLLDARSRLLKDMATLNQAATRPHVPASQSIGYQRATGRLRRTEERVGRLIFRPVQMEYRDLKGRTWPTVRTLQSWSLGIGTVTTIEATGDPHHGYTVCGPGLDVAWSPTTIAIMQTKGLWQEIYSTGKAELSDIAWDGQYIWAASRYAGILILDLKGRLLGQIDEPQGLPPAGNLMRLHTLEPGKALAAGCFGEQNRAWCAIVEWSPGKTHVNVFHRAARLHGDPGSPSANVELERTFQPSWVRECQRLSPTEHRRFLVGRNTGDSLVPLLVDLSDMHVSLATAHDLFPYDIPPIRRLLSTTVEGPGHAEKHSLDGYLLPDGRRTKENAFTMPADTTWYTFAGGEWLVHNGLIDIVRCGVRELPTNKDLGRTWLRFDSGTGRIDCLTLDPLPRQFVEEVNYAVSEHYGILAWNRDGDFWQVEVEDVRSAATQAK